LRKAITSQIKPKKKRLWARDRQCADREQKQGKENDTETCLGEKWAGGAGGRERENGKASPPINHFEPIQRNETARFRQVKRSLTGGTENQIGGGGTRQHIKKKDTPCHQGKTPPAIQPSLKKEISTYLAGGIRGEKREKGEEHTWQGRQAEVAPHQREPERRRGRSKKKRVGQQKVSENPLSQEESRKVTEYIQEHTVGPSHQGGKQQQRTPFQFD